ncbi:hypothetical protein CMT41_17610 [Colwellia sp. MT41]|uniref:ligand-binding sensor domain-containing diguanylate cyclase n=1 Tax=Colwellia sp. MT41 TaxID=58049 RepID=UPI000717690A|nr:ligand-binding sensor domain-containing diguanylate cyclase [Colwellia sp. MT41]ALO36352.1 hypothetical protein CMT41_17610 [Colwellia sp. MT41]
MSKKIQFTLPFITLLFVTIFFSSIAFSFDGKPSIRFKHITIEDGLPQNSVHTILQGSTGFLWIGTEEGLVRYDGYSLKVFKHEPNNSHSLSDNDILSLIEDSRGNLWVGTRGGGLNYFNAKTQQFTQYRHQAGDLNSLSHDTVYSLLEDSQGNLWVGTRGGGLNHFNPKTQQFTHYRHQTDDANSLSDDDVFSLLEDSQGNLWVGTRGGGLNYFNAKTQQFTHYRHQAGDANSLSDDDVYSLVEDSQGNLWVGTHGGGLNYFNPKTQQFSHYRHQAGDANSLSDDDVYSLVEDSQGNLWVGTRGGLNHFNPKTQQFTQYRHQAGDANSLSHDDVFSLLEDSQGNLWVGTLGGGLNHFNPKIQQFTHYRHQSDDANSLSDDTVYSLLEDSQGNLWVGTLGGGLNYFNPQTQQFTHYRHQAGDANSLSDDDVFSLLEDSQGNLWVGTRGGLNHFNPKTQQFSQYRHQTGDANSLSHDTVYSLLEDSQGNLWVGTLGGGLNHFNPKTQQFSQYRHQAGDANSLSDDDVFSLLEDSQGNLWVGTYGGGLNHFNPKTQQFTHYRHQSDDANSLSHDSVYSLLEDNQGNLWVGTPGGLNLFNNKTAKFKRFTTENGLANNVIYRIEEDKQGNIWLSTNQGLSRMTLKAKTFRNYDVGDGLQSNEFNSGASFKSKNGELFFGGINGFNRFYPENIIDDKQVPIVLITDMFLLNESVPIVPLVLSNSPTLEQNSETKSLLDSSSSNAVDEVAGFSLTQAIHVTKAITLTYKDNIVAFEFAALHFSNPKKNKFAYQLVGWDKDWVSTDYKNRRATYTNLPNGDYTFRVKASNADGYWNEEGASLNITVLPPPWKTWWAYTFYGLFLLSLVLAFIDSQRKKVIVERVINEQLERKVAERTAELEKVSLTDQLTGAHNRRFFHKHIGKEIAQIKRAYFKPKEGTPPKIGFIMLDMDHFKQVNDVHGHDAGDRVLVQLVKVITDTCRESDWVVRWGGEEFVVIANTVNLQEIQNLAERIRINIEAYSFDIGNGKTLNKTCSIGISSYPFIEQKPEALSWEQTLSFADIALYAVKNNGRNAWISLFEKDITNVDLLIEVTNSIETLIKNGHLSYGTSLQQEVDWS